MENEKSLTLVQNVDDLGRVGMMLAKSGYFIDATDAAQASVKVLAGMEMGFGAFSSMTGIHLIKGKPTVGANLMAAAVKASPKYDYRVLKMEDDEVCIEFFERVNGKLESIGKSKFDVRDAQKAGTQNMGKFPRNMLFARAISNGIKWYCPDVFNGSTTYVPEELGVEVDDEGNVKIENDGTIKLNPQIEPAIIEAEAVPVNENKDIKKEQKLHALNYPGDEKLLRGFELPKNFQTSLTVEDARAMKDTAGMSYGEKDLGDLYIMYDAIMKRLERNQLADNEKIALQDKACAILLIFNDEKVKRGF